LSRWIIVRSAIALVAALFLFISWYENASMLVSTLIASLRGLA
jgi:hypothetical protein